MTIYSVHVQSPEMTELAIKVKGMSQWPTHFFGSTSSVVLVKRGFSWPAFFFGILWALYKGLWASAAVIFGIYLGVVLLENVLVWVLAPARESLGDFMTFVAAGVLGVTGNDLWRWQLKRKGFAPAGFVTAKDRFIGLQDFLKENPRYATTATL